MKVYVLSYGEYSGWHIEGIFSSLESLEKGKAKLIGHGKDIYNPPDEYELDELVSHDRGPTFIVSINCDTGKLVDSPISGEVLVRHPGRCRVIAWHNSQRNSKEWMITVESPVSAEHANKVAVEKRQEWLRVHAMAPKAFSEEIDV